MFMSSAKFGEKIARIDLNTGKTSIETIRPELSRLFLGGRGLGAYLLYRDNESGVDPLGPDNKLIVMTGPLSGTGSFGSSRYVLTTKSPLTGIYLMSISGGHFGSELRRAGFDGLILEGRAEKPAYVYIEDGKISLRDASAYWGMTTFDTQQVIKESLRDNDVQIACIGPAGENLVPYACVINERRAAGRGGAGAVMGSKNVKAIVVKGRFDIEVADRQAFRDILRQAGKELAVHPTTSKSMPLYGTTGNVTKMNAAGMLPIRNWQKNWASSGPDRISGESMRPKFMVRDVACATPCPVRCSKLALVREGQYAGTLSEGPEYETLYAFGSCCDVWDAEAVIAADAMCDSLGLDTISTGVTIAFAMECFERGLITTKDTGGMELCFGSHSNFQRLIKEIAYREGFGAMLALGTRKLSEQIGCGSSQFAMHVKGMELGAYDPRGATGMALVFACGPRGGCHHAGGYSVTAELAAEGKYDRFSSEGKSSLVKATRDRRCGGSDSAPMCNFVAVGISDDTFAGIIAAATGQSFSAENLYILGERISTVERMFSIREGLTRDLDTLPVRLLKEGTTEGPCAGRKVDLELLVEEFHRECGWDLETGCPTEERIAALGLSGIL